MIVIMLPSAALSHLATRDRVATPEVSSRATPCSGCVATRDQNLRWLAIPCDCSGSSGPYFGYLVITDEHLLNGSCSGFWECSDPNGCSWQYDLELQLDPDRREDCFPDGVWAEKTGWPARLNILSYDFGTLSSIGKPCTSAGDAVGNQVSVGIYASASSSTMCAGVIMRVKCTKCNP